jgi:hypothetical protein
VVKIPVGSEALQCPDIYWLVEFSTATPAFAGMMADAAANSGEGITLPDCLDSLQVFTRCNMSHIFRDIDAYRAGMLTG